MTARPGRTSTVTPIGAALEVDDAAQLTWDVQAEVVVVGHGAAGACAAIEARAAGADVLVIDRFLGGGASKLSGGVVYAGGGTPFQRQAGFEDSPEAMRDYLRHETGGVVSEATLQRFCEDSAANLAWLQAQGVAFEATMPDFKTSYPPQGRFLYYSGNEVVPAYGGAQPPAPRGHRAVARGQSGTALFAALQDSTQRAGARLLLQSAVRRLVVQRGTAPGQPARVLGVEAWRMPPGQAGTRRHAELQAAVERWRTLRPGKAAAARREAAALELALAQPVLVRATHAVVLSTGGFVYHPELLAQHAPAFRRGWPIGGAGCDGSGLRLGLSVGAAAQHLDNVSAWRFITPPSVWPRGIVVNGRGERFCNEQVYGATLGHEMVAHHGGRGWLVLDARLRRQAMRECLFSALWAFQRWPALAAMLGARRGRTPEALAASIGADPASLRRSLQRYNEAAHGRAEDDFGKSTDMRQPLEQGPYWALDISIGSKLFPLATLTLGGLQVNEDDGHVVDAQGRDIRGLFAAGRTAVGLPSRRYVSGLSLADCVFSGRRAGRAAAVEAGKAARGASASALAA